jgi:transposase
MKRGANMAKLPELLAILRMGWTGRAPALSGRASKHEEHAAMLQKTNAVAVRTIGIDTGKNTLHLIGLDQQGTIVLREKLARGRIGRRLANASPCLIGIEAGMATHYVARELLALGHDVRQVPPAYAKPFRQGHKNDFRDAYAIAEAVLRPSTRCVPVKTDDQLDLQALHRVRSRLFVLGVVFMMAQPIWRGRLSVMRRHDVLGGILLLAGAGLWPWPQ